MQNSFQLKTSNNNEAKNLTIQHVKEQAQDHEDSAEECCESESCDACAAKAVTKQTHECHLLLRLKQVLACISSVFLKPCMLSSKQEVLFIKLISQLLIV